KEFKNISFPVSNGDNTCFNIHCFTCCQLRRKKVIAGYKALMQQVKQWILKHVLSPLLTGKLIFLNSLRLHALTIWIFLFGQFKIVGCKLVILRSESCGRA